VFVPEQRRRFSVRQELVVAEPRALSVERDDERVRFLQCQQHLLGARAAGQQVGELTVHPVDKRGSQQHALNLARLALEHLGHQVLPDSAVGPGELGHETLGLRVTGKRDHRQAQASRPTLGVLVQRGHPFGGQVDRGPGKQFARLVLGERRRGSRRSRRRA
jgi:hypothetical protein